MRQVKDIFGHTPTDQAIVSAAVDQWQARWLNTGKDTSKTIVGMLPTRLQGLCIDKINERRYKLTQVNGGKCPCLACAARSLLQIPPEIPIYIEPLDAIEGAVTPRIEILFLSPPES